MLRYGGTDRILAEVLRPAAVVRSPLLIDSGVRSREVREDARGTAADWLAEQVYMPDRRSKAEDAHVEAAGIGPGMPEIRGVIQPDARPVGDLPTMLRVALAPAHASTLLAVLACRRGRRVDPLEFAERLGRDRDGALAALDDADAAFRNAFDVRMLTAHRSWFEAGGGDGTEHGDADQRGPAAVAEAPEGPSLSSAFLDLVTRPHEAVRPTRTIPQAMGDVAAWIGALSASVEDACGLHLALRCPREGGRDFDDLVALLAAAGVAACRVDADGRALPAQLLRAEWHVDASLMVVIVEGRRLVEAAEDDGDGWVRDLGREPDGEATAFAKMAMGWLAAMRCPCVWCVDADALVPPSLDRLVAGCIGPIRPDPEWSRRHIAEAVGAGVGAAGVAALAATLDDARDVGARAAAVRRLHGAGLAIDAACATLARSLVPTAEAPAKARPFDLGLHAHDGEIATLFARAREIAEAGGRLLFVGGSGAGKSALARALAARMAEAGAAGPAVTVSASMLLARAYGATERLLEALWRRAAIARAPLIVDEIDAMCGVRDPSSSSGNAYLVRVLTDEWLRRFDAHPGVVVLATCNDLRAVDPAVLRRFDWQHAIGDRLPPDLERRAWDTILSVAPPVGWSPCGAAPSDFATALKRCRMLGLLDPASLSRAVERARDARRGPRAPRRATPGPVH